MSQMLSSRPSLSRSQANCKSQREHQAGWLQAFSAHEATVTVCIANWNCRAALQDCLESLLDIPQGVQVEVIVVDNASTDGAPEMVAREFPEVKLIRNAHNLGFARANNQAGAIALGRFLLFLNNDTVLPAYTLHKLVSYAEAHPELGILGPKLLDPTGYCQVSWRPRPTMSALLHRLSCLRWTRLLRSAHQRYRRAALPPDRPERVDIVMGAAMLLRREVFAEVGGWDEHFVFGGEDSDLSLRVGQKYPVIYHPEIALTHLGRLSTKQHLAFTAASIPQGQIRLLRKAGFRRWQLGLYKLLVTFDSPIVLVEKALQTLYRKASGRDDAAQRSWTACRSAWHFLRSLWKFWRA